MSLSNWGIGASKPLPGPEDLGRIRLVKAVLDRAGVPSQDYRLETDIGKSVEVVWNGASRRNEETVLAECYQALTRGRFKSVTRSQAWNSRTRHGKIHHFPANVTVVLKR
jgi:hypothetical protein